MLADKSNSAKVNFLRWIMSTSILQIINSKIQIRIIRYPLYICRNWDDILYSTSYHLYALSGFLICLIVCLFVSLLSRLCLRQYRPVEPLLLHPLVRSKDTISDIQRHNHPPYVLSQFQPFYGNRNQACKTSVPYSAYIIFKVNVKSPCKI